MNYTKYKKSDIFVSEYEYDNKVISPLHKVMQKKLNKIKKYMKKL